MRLKYGEKMKDSELEEMAREEYDEMNREETPLELLEKKMLIKLQEERREKEKGKGKGKPTMTKKEMKLLKMEAKEQAAKALRDVTPEDLMRERLMKEESQKKGVVGCLLLSVEEIDRQVEQFFSNVPLSPEDVYEQDVVDRLRSEEHGADARSEKELREQAKKETKIFFSVMTPEGELYFILFLFFESTTDSTR